MSLAHLKKLATLSAAILCFVQYTHSHADEIATKDARYKDVLITKTSANYYVQIPWEGRTISVPTGEVDANSVVINKDLYYRDELKEHYQETKARREAGELLDAPDDPAFKVEAPGSGAPDIDALLGAGSAAGGKGGKGGFTQSRANVEAMLTGFGMQFQPGAPQNGQPTVVSNPPGGPTIILMGPPDTLKGITIKMTGAPALIQTGMAQLGLLASQIAPALAPQLTAMVAEAQQSGNSSRSAGGLNAQVNFTPSGSNTVNFELSIKS